MKTVLVSSRRSFTQADVSRAIKGAQSAGLKIAKLEIEPTTGRIVVIAIDTLVEKHASELEKWRARRSSR